MNNLGKIRVSNEMIPIFWNTMPDIVNVLESCDAPGDTTIFLCKSDLFRVLKNEEEIPFYLPLFTTGEDGRPKFLKMQKD